MSNLILVVISAKFFITEETEKKTEKRKRNLRDLRNLHEDKHAAWPFCDLALPSSIATQPFKHT